MSNVKVTNQSGLNGGQIIVGPFAAQTGKWEGVQVINDAVLAGLTSNLSNDAGLVGPTLNAGTTIFGRTTSIEVTSGIVIAYNSSASA